MLKTHNCGELRLSDAGKSVRLAGWLQRRRDLGNLIFIDLRDRSGLVQVTVDPSVGDAHGIVDKARNEYVLQITGTVRPRPEGSANPNLPSGEIEVLAESISILNEARTPPMPLDDDGYRTEETTRLKYRYLISGARGCSGTLCCGIKPSNSSAITWISRVLLRSKPRC